MLIQSESSLPLGEPKRQEAKACAPSLSSFFDALPAPAVCVDRRSKIIHANLGACRLFGYEPAEILNRKFQDLLAPTSVGAQILTAESSSKRNLDELGWRKKCGSIFHAKSRHHTLPIVPPEVQGQIWMWVECCREDSEMIEAVRRLAEQREAERLRLARDLHDGVVQELLGMGFSLTELRRKIEAKGIQLEGQPVAALQADVARIARMLRSLVSELRPAGLEEFGLRDTLEGHVAKVLRDLNGQHPEVRIDIQAIPELTSPQELCLFRTAQEALVNCIKHGHASQILISLKRLGSEALMLIKDDGKGFEVAAHLVDLTRSRHYGLAGMLERVQLVGGHLSVHSIPGKGTEVRVTVSLEDPCAL